MLIHVVCANSSLGDLPYFVGKRHHAEFEPFVRILKLHFRMIKSALVRRSDRS